MTQPLAKIAVSGGYDAMGLLFWQQIIGAVLLITVCLARGRRLPFGPDQMRVYLVIALIGTVLPGLASLNAARHLPAGLLAILLSLVPMFGFVIALGLAIEPFRWSRFGGLLFGLGGVALLILPDASLPERAMIAFIPLALVAPLFYGLEGNVVAKWGTAGLDPVQVLAGASVIGAIICGPLAWAQGGWIDPLPPYAAPDLALATMSAIHAVVYSAYVWLIGRAGAVFAVQVSYVVTVAGVVWAMILLGERYSGWIWLALALIFAGLALVQPRPRGPDPA